MVILKFVIEKENCKMIFLLKYIFCRLEEKMKEYFICLFFFCGRWFGDIKFYRKDYKVFVYLCEILIILYFIFNCYFNFE